MRNIGRLGFVVCAMLTAYGNSAEGIENESVGRNPMHQPMGNLQKASEMNQQEEIRCISPMETLQKASRMSQ